MWCYFAVFVAILCFHFTSSQLENNKLQKRAGKEDDEPATVMNSGAQREKRQDGFTPNIPDEVKEEFKNYATNYLNSMATDASREKSENKETATSKRAQICAEVCQHRCLPSCEWSCCIKENIEEYRSAHLVKSLVTRPRAIQRKSKLATADANEEDEVGKRRDHVAKVREEETMEDGHDCNVSCKRYCVPSCRFACCQAVQIKGVLMF